MTEAKTYWLEQFAGPVPILELPTGRQRPALQTYKGAQQQTTIEASLCGELKSLSVEQNCTLFTTLLAAFKVLLYRLTSQEDIVIGIPTVGQVSAGGEHLVGHCVNLLPLRSRVSGDLTFTDYLTSVKSALLDAYHHQIYPFINLIGDLKLPRDPSRLPLVSTTINLDRSGKLQFFGLDVDISPNPIRSTQFDMFLDITQTDWELQVKWKYNAVTRLLLALNS